MMLGSQNDQAEGGAVALTARRPFYGWKLLAVFWFVLLANLGFPMYGGALLNSLMATQLHFSREMLGLPFAVFTATIGLTSPVVAAIILRIGVRWTLVLGNICVIAGAAIMATLVTTGVAATAVFGGVVGFGVAAGGNLTAQTAIPRWFVRRRAAALAIMLTASALGGFLAPPLINYTIASTQANWRLGWWIICGMAFAAAVLAGLMVRESPEDVGQLADGDPAAQAGAAIASAPLRSHITADNWSLRDAAGTSTFWILALASAAATGGLMLTLAHGARSIRDAGYPATTAAFALSLVAITGLGGKFVVGFCGDRFDPKLIWAALMIIMGGGLLVGAVGTQIVGPYAFAICLGAGFGGVVVCQPAVMANLFGKASFAAIASTIYLLQAIGGGLVPWLGGRSYDATGSYRTVFIAAAAACVVSGVLLALARKPERAARPT